jgi:hypothetical protein
MTGTNVTLHIERLVLEGVGLPAGESEVLRAAVVEELTRLVAASGVSPALQAVAVAPGGSLRMPAKAAAGELGLRIAGAMYAALAPSEGSPAAAAPVSNRSSVSSA